MVEKAKKEVDHVIKQEGENATYETGVYGLHPEIVKLLGRLKYRTSYGQSVLTIRLRFPVWRNYGGGARSGRGACQEGRPDP